LNPEPPGYRIQRPRHRPKIDPFLERIAEIIDTDKSLPKKQRHTANRIYERLKEEDYQGGYTQVKDSVRKIRRVKREIFMPLINRPGEAQVDFGFALAKMAGV
jgi:transposase